MANRIYVNILTKSNEVKTLYFNSFDEYTAYVWRHGNEISKQLHMGTC